MFRIRRFGIIRTANLAAIVYALVTLLFLVPIALILLAAGSVEFTDSLGRTARIELSPVWLIVIPLVYAIVGWLITALFCLMYNLAAAITGGIEMELRDETGRVRSMETPPPA